MGTCGRVRAYGRVWRHVAGCGGMWQRWWQGVGPCHRGRDKLGQACGIDRDMWQG